MNLAEHFPMQVGDDDHGQRLDQILARNFPEVSRSRWAKLIDSGFFLVNAKVAASAQKLQKGARIECAKLGALEKALLPDHTLEKAGARSAAMIYTGPVPDILFEDESMIIVNKPVGLAVHPGSGLKLEETLVGWLLQQRKLGEYSSEKLLQWGSEVLEEQRPGIVHRLDRGTSGALVVAKDPQAHRDLSEQFSNRSASRLYWAVVMGDVQRLLEKRPRKVDEFLVKVPCPLAFRISEQGLVSLASYISRDPQHRTRFRVPPVEEGRKAVTHFCSISQSAGFSLLELKLETGRTHQIRVHLSFLDFPVLGDTTYGGRPHERLLLHAHRLQVTHPVSKQRIEVEAPWPEKDADWIKAQGLVLESKIKSLQRVDL